MNDSRLSPDDPRLTAYALGEMTPAERAAFEPLLAADPRARQAVAEIRAFAGDLGATLAQEPLPEVRPLPVEDLRQAAIIAGTDPRKYDGGPPRPGWGQMLRFPQLYYVTAGLAAACFAVFFVLQESPSPEPRPVPMMAAAKAARNAPAVGAVALPTEGASADRVANVAASAQISLVSAEEVSSGAFVATTAAMESSFPLHVGRDSYALVREQLRRGVRPAPATVHVAELVNAFTYRWPSPAEDEAFSTVLEEAAAPWEAKHRLVRIALKGRTGVEGLIAHDAVVRVIFNPGQVQAWRLIGFSRGDAAAGVLGEPRGVDLMPGESVTALYEIIPAESAAKPAGSLLSMALAYTEPTGGRSRTIMRELAGSGRAFAEASADFRFAATVAAFGARLQGDVQQPAVPVAELVRWAHASADAQQDREEFAGLIMQAGAM